MRTEPNSPSQDGIIEFIELYNLNTLRPVMANKLIPDWYKEQKPIYQVNNFSDLTIKRCIPFLDAMTAGYFLVTTQECNVTDNGIISTKYNNNFITKHPREQFGKLTISNNFYQDIYKWNNQYLIKTPNGVSCMILHPNNWNDLPFFTLSGIVDTDTFINPISFPFLLNKNFNGIIPKNTPVVQIIPFRRENFSIELNKTLTKELINSHKEKSQKYESGRYDQDRNPLGGMYKKQYWKPKNYG